MVVAGAVTVVGRGRLEGEGRLEELETDLSALSISIYSHKASLCGFVMRLISPFSYIMASGKTKC